MAITAAPIAAIDTSIVRPELFRPYNRRSAVGKTPQGEDIILGHVGAPSGVHFVVAVGLLVLVEIVVSHGPSPESSWIADLTRRQATRPRVFESRFNLRVPTGLSVIALAGVRNKDHQMRRVGNLVRRRRRSWRRWRFR